MILAVDLSNNNPQPDFPRLRKAGIAAVILKATEGETFVDHDFAPWRRAAHAAGLFVGAYHFARPSRLSAVAQAGHFADRVGKLAANELRPALDLEVNGGLDRTQLLEWSRDWLRAVQARLGVSPLFYSYPDFLDHLRPSQPLGGGLWLASYNNRYSVRVPAPWKQVVLHQFTAQGHVPGAGDGVDVNYAPSLLPLLAHPVRAVVAHPVRCAKARHK